MSEKFTHFKKGHIHIMNDSTSQLLHNAIGEAALSMIMTSRLKTITKKVVIVKSHDIRVGCFYVDDQNNIFTLSSKLLQTVIVNPDANTAKLGNVSLSDFRSNITKYLNDIGHKHNFKPQDNFQIITETITSKTLSHIKSLDKMYNYNDDNKKLKQAFPTLESLKEGVQTAIDTLIRDNTWSDNLPINNTDKTSADLKTILLKLLSHYMFEYQDEQFFFTNTHTDWFVKLSTSKNSFSKSIFDTNAQEILKAEKYWSDPNPNNHHLADPIIASLILNYWSYLFEGHTFMRDDNAFKIIHAKPTQLAILPSDKTASIISKSNTTDAKIILIP